MLSIEQAIQHCLDKAKELRAEAEGYSDLSVSHFDRSTKAECLECAKEHKQLAEWLTKLKHYEENRASCEFCKYRKVPAYEEPCNKCRHAYDNKFEFDVELLPKENDK